MRWPIQASDNTYKEQALEQPPVIMVVADPGGDDWGDRPPKTYESIFVHHDVVQFGKQCIKTNSE